VGIVKSARGGRIDEGATDNHETFSPIPCPVDRTIILRQQRGLDVDSPNLQQQRDDTDMTHRQETWSISFLREMRGDLVEASDLISRLKQRADHLSLTIDIGP
jgi:hypothetical protein